MSLGFAILGKIFAYVTVFNPTREVVTFCLRGKSSAMLLPGPGAEASTSRVADLGNIRALAVDVFPG